MKHIQWYPGHIAKAQRQLKEKLNLTDVIIEVIDARIPYSSWYKTTDKLCPNKKRIILFNKSDTADKTKMTLWLDCIKKLSGCEVFETSMHNKSDRNFIIQKVLSCSKEIMEKRAQKGLLERPSRIMVIGMPNVGKSSTINKLIKRAKTKTGAKAGVTREQQWVRIDPRIELLDTPGIIPMALDDQKQALKLAFVNSIGNNAYDSEYVANELINYLDKNYKNEIRKYFDFSLDEIMDLSTIAIKKNRLLKGNIPDTKRCADVILKSFREGKIGNFTLEEPNDYGLI